MISDYPCLSIIYALLSKVAPDNREYTDKCMRSLNPQMLLRLRIYKDFFGFRKRNRNSRVAMALRYRAGNPSSNNSTAGWRKTFYPNSL